MNDMRKTFSMLLPSLVIALGACGGLDQSTPGTTGKGDSFSDNGEVVFTCHEQACEPQCEATLQQLATSPETCVRGQHEGFGCTIVCYDTQVPPAPTPSPAPGSSSVGATGSICSVDGRGECDHPRAYLNSQCFCGGLPGRIIR